MSTYTRKDVCRLLSVEEHRVRQWMQLAPFSSRLAIARSPRRFDLHDLELLPIAHDLLERYGLSARVLESVLPELEFYLRRQKPRSEPERAVFSVETWCVEDVDGLLPPGFIVDIEAARDRVGRFLGVIPAQEELPLGAASIRRKRA